VLCLGNESLADDALGHEVADQLQKFVSKDVEIVDTPESGIHLLDYVLNARRLAVVDTIQTGDVPVGTILHFPDGDMRAAQGGSPHYVGMFEALEVARRLGLPVADDVLILAVEAKDCLSFGKEMCPAVRSAIPELVRMVEAMIPTPAEPQLG
jgi:hydrogenase maturation protease